MLLTPLAVRSGSTNPPPTFSAVVAYAKEVSQQSKIMGGRRVPLRSFVILSRLLVAGEAGKAHAAALRRTNRATEAASLCFKLST